MTSPNEQGAPNQGDNPNGDAVVDRAGVHRATTGPGRLPDSGESPPWQRGATRASSTTQRAAADPPTDVRPTTASSAADARLNRFITGSPTPTSGTSGKGTGSPPEPDAPSPRSENPPAEAYASELPDLSGPIPGPARKSAPERAAEKAPAARPGAARAAAAEARGESREGRVQVSPRRATRGPVRASMQIRRIDPWSTLKVSLLLSVALFFVWMIAVAFLYLVLGGMGVWAKLNSNVGDLLNNTSGSSGELVSSGTIFGGAVLIGLVNIVLMTAMATIAAFVYNLTTDLIGGIEVTLADRD
ncbi:hypothetical protein BST27_07955 [Mycobacterium intermedium]|uniref:DUF3566 domain-containing protein n=1 Tax=Mycobacterium intermedium TaxID=28445 RepID=A0A1T3W810_MYCIE|nr:DUF3566 domain-containing protein [Mycobacterium intermedium]MCV6967353.1 DUF3566 domain-containing protein [Mycobacterium intermedium]OPE50457.1 hypothetical protein BV508_10215 [Mycobacterium intermedium]ORB08183.1 hypothetical protein BST27_07955 [Mycobacterium intermedium]